MSESSPLLPAVPARSSLANSSRPGPSVPDPSPSEVTLDQTQEEALRSGLFALNAPATGPEFNARLTGALRSGNDFRALPAQIATRLGWMAMPALLGFGITWALAQSGVGRPADRSAQAAPFVVDVPAPPLPPLDVGRIRSLVIRMDRLGGRPAPASNSSFGPEQATFFSKKRRALRDAAERRGDRTGRPISSGQAKGEARP